MSSPVMAVTVHAAQMVPNSATIPAQSAPPSLAQVTSGAQSQRFERVMITDVNLYGEGAPSTEAVLQVQAGNVLVVSKTEMKFPSGDYQGKPYGFNVYATLGGTGTETKQNTTPILTGQVWQEPATGLIAGTALPSPTAPLPDDTINSNVNNIPPATGNIVVAQSPAGTVNTNTGRTNQSTETFMAKSLNALNVGTTPPPTGNLPH